VFDPVFSKDTPLPVRGEPPLAAVRRYRVAHDVAHYRFVEASRLHADGSPGGRRHTVGRGRGRRGARLHRRLESPPSEVHRLDHEGPEVTERYRLDGDGIIRVTVEGPDGRRIAIEPSIA
jgi:hypothetical protein